MSKLTDKQERFVQELIKGKTQREAYKTAYNCVKMKDTTIDVKACELFKKDKIKVRYNTIHDRLVKEAEDESIVTAKEVLRELKKIGFADIKDYLSFTTDESNNQRIQLFDSDKVDGRVIQEVSLNSKGTFTFKLYDKLSALDKLAKHLGMYTEKVEVTANVNNPFEGLTTEQLLKLVGDEDEQY